jgi:hypothetical protein
VTSQELQGWQVLQAAQLAPQAVTSQVLQGWQVLQAAQLALQLVLLAPA